MRILVTTLWLTVTGLALPEPASLRAQDPARDFPARRVQPRPDSAACVQIGLRRLQAGWSWEAMRMFRELLLLDATAPQPHLLLAVATRDAPNRAARHCWDALQRRQHGAVDAVMGKLLDAYRDYFAVTAQPELVDPKFATAPPRGRAVALVGDLQRLVANGSEPDRPDLAASDTARSEATRSEATSAPLASRDLARSLLAIERQRLAGEGGESLELGRSLEAVDASRLLAQGRGYLRASGLPASLVPGLLAISRAAGWTDAQLARLPRHPDLQVWMPQPFRSVDGLQLELAEQHADASGLLQSGLLPVRAAPAFELPNGIAGRGTLAQHAGKPVLVVFFLGFGCAHCVAQLRDLDPKAPKFRAAGIEVVTIGTDDVNAVRAARQAADENGVDPLHFDVLCDPGGKTFREWGVWDEFTDEALHGTFLVDERGRILWQDVSLRPFEESDWLLAECRRLLAAWRQS